MKNLTFLFLLFGLFFTACKTESAEDVVDETAEEDKENWKDKPIDFKLPNGFEIEDLYQAKERSMGSWVALAEGPNQMMYASDQYGDLYQFKIPAIGQTLDSTAVDSVDLEIGHAHGMIWAFNSLYVAVNKRWDDEVPDEEERGSGIYRLTDNDGDGNLDKIDMLLKLKGQGEHGPHSFLVGPSGKDLYFIAGNYTNIPEKIQKNSRLPNNWGEDNLFPQYLDARGHANELTAPGGWVAKFEPNGNNFELVVAGFRNPFDFAFNEDGELFVYDADMEWDIGMPWYRPTRVLHAVSGGEFGWRTGSGKWPEYYPDALPAAHNLEQGSPTGVLAGHKLKAFPSKYQNGIFVMDWSFGTMYYIDLKEKGSSYTGTREEFLGGKPLPLTDIIAGSDGHMYFATGGRRLKSHLFRLRYTGGDLGTAKLMANDEAANLRALRKSLEAFHNKKSSKAIGLAWANLGHADRNIRYASRIALEHQAVNKWELRFFRESDNEKIIQSGLAMARQGHKGVKEKLLNKLSTVDWSQLNERQQLDLIRVYQLIGIRMGMPNTSDRETLLANLRPQFPSSNKFITRELSQLLIFLKDEKTMAAIFDQFEKSIEDKGADGISYLSKEVTERSEDYGPLIEKVLENMPPRSAMYYAMLLSHAEAGWTKEMREKYFQWYFDIMSAKGGLSMKPFLENMKIKALEKIPEAEREYYRELSGVYSPMSELADLPQPIGPGGTYNNGDINRMIGNALKVGNYKGTLVDGERAFQAALCSTCHRMNGKGSNIGPDLSQAHSKFKRGELINTMTSPNDEISDQYAFTLFHTQDGKKQAGRIMSEKGDVVKISPNPYNPTFTIDLAKADITKRELSPVSPMPPGLLNRLNEEEIQHLFAYLLTGADDTHEIYTGIKKEEDEEKKSD